MNITVAEVLDGKIHIIGEKTVMENWKFVSKTW